MDSAGDECSKPSCKILYPLMTVISGAKHIRNANPVELKMLPMLQHGGRENERRPQSLSHELCPLLLRGLSKTETVV